MKLKRSSLLNARIFGVVLAVVFAALGLYKVFINDANSAVSTNPLINISELPEEFMETYLTDYAKIASGENKENVLIVTSKNPLERSFGAKNVVNAANNRYFLEFETKDEKTLALEMIEGLPNLKVEENRLYSFDDDEEKREFNSWGIEKMGLGYASEMIEETGTANEIVVAVLDTGLDVELFNENFPDKLAGTYSVVSGEIEVPDEVGHGTHTAGTIAEGTPSNVKIFSVQLSKERGIYTTDIIAGMDYATYYTNADVVNMSFGGYYYEEAEYISLEAMRENKMIPVASAGNESTSDLSYPASFDNTISVSALDVNLNFASEFSNFGKTIDFAAPGVNILSINGTMDGTSMAAPHVSAAAAIAKSFNKDFDVETVKEFLATRAVDLGAKGKDSKYGFGFIDFNDARKCTNESEACDDFGVFEIEKENKIEVTEVILTPYNYGSLTNILATKIKIINESGSYREKSLGDFGADVEITGYNPYASGEQVVSVKYGEMVTSFTVENPENWESGWVYVDRLNEEQGYDERYVNGYKDHELNIKTLHFPEMIDGKTIVGSDSCPFSIRFGDGGSSWTCDESIISKDAKQYETVILPETYKHASGFYGRWDGEEGNFQNLYKVISMADELIVSGQAFANLRSLVELDANVSFKKTYQGYSPEIGYYGDIWYAPNVFSNDISLEKITLSENNDVIPSNSFDNCGSLEEIVLPEGIKEIRTQAFYKAGIRRLDLNRVEKLEAQAFYENSRLEEILIPSTLTDIDKTAFFRADNLSSITVDAENPVFDSRDNCNAIIETAKDEVYLGTVATIIPESVKSIGEKAFYDVGIGEIEIPEGVEEIKSEAFANCAYLYKVVLPKNSLNSIAENAFDSAGYFMPSRAVFWIWNNTYAKDWVFEHEYPYVMLDEIEEGEPKPIANATFEVLPEGKMLYAFDTLTSENFIIKIFYYDEEAKKVIDEPEIVTDYSVVYNNGESDSLNGGSNKVAFTFNTAEGYRNVRIELWLSARFIEPEYTIPEGISAWSGQPLAEVELPDGFAWMNEEEFVVETKAEYLASFTPEDAIHYAVVNKIAIPVEVKTGTTFAEIFPDETLRACIIRNLNGETGNYTEETVDLNEVLAMTELECAADEHGEKITNARGIEQMVNLKSLNLEGNSLERINLSKNLEIEHLNLRGNKLQELDITENLALEQLLVDESGLEDGNLLLKTAAYIEMVEQDNDTVKLVMNISELDFLKNADFTIEDANATYDAEAGLISWPANNPVQDVRITVRTESGESVSYLIYTFPREIYATVFLDGEMYEEDIDFGFTYTGGKLDLEGFDEYLLMILDLSGYELEDVVVADNLGLITVGKSDVRINMYFKKTGQQGGDEPDPDEPDEPIVDPDNPDEPGDPDDPGQDPGTGDNGGEEGSAVGTPETGAFTIREQKEVSKDDTMTLLLFISAAFVLTRSLLPSKTSRRFRQKF